MAYRTFKILCYNLRIIQYERKRFLELSIDSGMGEKMQGFSLEIFLGYAKEFSLHSFFFEELTELQRKYSPQNV